MINEGSSASVEHHDPAGKKTADDSRLLQRVGKGDQIAFEQLYAHYNAKVYNYILRLVHEQSAAEELHQESFVAVWRGAARFRSRASVKTWIFRIAHNLAVSWLRKHAGHELLDESRIPAAEWRVDENLMAEWQAEQIAIVLDRLSPNHRAVVELVFEHGLSYREIAQVMDCPVGTVKSRMSYALKNLTQLLQNTELGG